MPTAKRPSKPSAWNAHLAAFRASHPRLTMKECMQQASKSYRCSAGAGAVSQDVQIKAAAPSKTNSSKKASVNPWIAHVQAYKAKYGCSYTDALKGAANTYKSSSQKINVIANKCPVRTYYDLKNDPSCDREKHYNVEFIVTPPILPDVHLFETITPPKDWTIEWKRKHRWYRQDTPLRKVKVSYNDICKPKVTETGVFYTVKDVDDKLRLKHLWVDRRFDIENHVRNVDQWFANQRENQIIKQVLITLEGKTLEGKDDLILKVKGYVAADPAKWVDRKVKFNLWSFLKDVYEDKVKPSNLSTAFSFTAPGKPAVVFTINGEFFQYDLDGEFTTLTRENLEYIAKKISVGVIGVMG